MGAMDMAVLAWAVWEGVTVTALGYWTWIRGREQNHR
jgi:hypothetical protein